MLILLLPQFLARPRFNTCRIFNRGSLAVQIDGENLDSGHNHKLDMFVNIGNKVTPIEAVSTTPGRYGAMPLASTAKGGGGGLI